MKHATILVFISFCMTMVFGQTKEVTVIVDMAPLQTNTMWADASGGVQLVKPNKDGKYVFHITGKFPQEARIGIDSPYKGGLYLFLEEGDNLQVKTDFKGNTRFSGKGVENARVLNKYMQAYIDGSMKLDAKKVSMTELYKQADDLQQMMIDMLESSKQRVSPAFYAYESVALRYQKFTNGIIMPYIYHQGFGKKMSETIPADYWHLDDSIRLDESLLSIPSYVSFIEGSYPIWLGFRERYKLGTIDSTYPREETLIMRYEMAAKNYSGKIRGMGMYGGLRSLMQEAKDVKVYKSLIDDYVSQYAGTEEAKEISSTFEKMIALAVGQAPPPFTLKDLNGKEVSLKDFAGKVVYMDFWASWCTPCRYEMKNGSPKLHEKFKDNKDVVFLYISIDDNAERWKKAIAEDKIKGIHLLSAGGMNSKAAQAFAIQGVPRYIIIGRDGKIFDNDASRPSEDKTPGRINEALKGS